MSEHCSLVCSLLQPGQSSGGPREQHQEREEDLPQVLSEGAEEAKASGYTDGSRASAETHIGFKQGQSAPLGQSAKIKRLHRYSRDTNSD